MSLGSCRDGEGMEAELFYVLRTNKRKLRGQRTAEDAMRHALPAFGSIDFGGKKGYPPKAPMGFFVVVNTDRFGSMI